GTGADDDKIAQVCLIDRVVKTEAGSDLLIAWVPEDHFTATDDDRYVRDRDIETIQHSLYAFVTIEIHRGVRMTVTCQEVLDANSSRTMIRADQHNISEAPRDYLNPSEDERAQQNVTQLTVGLNQLHQTVTINIEYLRGFCRAYMRETAPPREHVDFARKHSS